MWTRTANLRTEELTYHRPSSAGKEFSCIVGDPNLIPGSGRFPGERIGYPVQYSWASLVTPTCNAENLDSIPGLGRSPGGGHDNPSSILAWRIPMDRRPWWAAVYGVAKSWT